MITVKLHGPLRQGRAQRTLAVPAGGTVQAVLERLCKEEPGLRPLVLDERVRMLPGLVALLDGQNVLTQGGLNTPVRAGSTLSLLYPIEGG